MNLATTRTIVGVACALLIAILAVQYVLAIPATAARERATACNVLSPTPTNPILGKFPRPAPEIQAMDYTGKMVPLSAYRGQVVFLNFWAPWCPPCVDEMPSMEDLAKDMQGQPFTVLAYASDDDWAPVRKFFPRGTAMTILLDVPAQGDNIGKLAQSWGTNAIPETYVIDKQGNIRYYFVNKRDWRGAKAHQCLRSLIEE